MHSPASPLCTKYGKRSAYSVVTGIPSEFVSASKTSAGPQPVFVARRADSYAISVDTLGKLRWSSGDLDGDHLVCVVSEQVTADYLTILREKGISYVVAGEPLVDLTEAVNGALSMLRSFLRIVPSVSVTAPESHYRS